MAWGPGTVVSIVIQFRFRRRSGPNCSDEAYKRPRVACCASSSMASSRLTDLQKEELVARFSQGEASGVLAEAYGVSVNTITRVVRTALPPELYDRLKQQRAKGGSLAPEPETAAVPETDAVAETAAGSETADLAIDPQEPASAPEVRPLRRRRSTAATPPEAAAATSPAEALEPPSAPEPEPARRSSRSSEDDSASEDRQGVLAIDDADDFGDDQGDDDFGDDSDDAELFVPVAVSLSGLDHQEPITCRPLAAANFNGGVYMLVDKLVELQPRPLRDISELGALPDEEADRQAITVFINPREAKRQCGRSQRVIKMPDPHLLERTAPYLLAQGISRVVVEGSLYALPGS